MRFLNTALFSLILCLIITSFSQCSSFKNPSEISFEKTNPIGIENPYFQSWIAGIQGGGSGINLYLPSQNTEIKLDSVYFRGMIAKAKIINTGYVAYFKTTLNQKVDMIMSEEDHAEYGNELPVIKTPFPFQLKENECVISYVEDNTTKYFKIINLFEMPIQLYPSAPPKH